jgi:hypothetical protein
VVPQFTEIECPGTADLRRARKLSARGERLYGAFWNAENRDGVLDAAALWRTLARGYRAALTICHFPKALSWRRRRNIADEGRRRLWVSKIRGEERA